MPKKIRPLTVDERIAHKAALFNRLAVGELDLGQAIREMREGYSGLNQAQFAKLAKVSVNTLSAVEKDAETANVKTLNRILHLFGMTLSLRNKHVPTPGVGE